MIWKCTFFTHDNGSKKDLFQYSGEGDQSKWKIFVDHRGAMLYRVSNFGQQSFVARFKLLRKAKMTAEFVDINM